MASPQTVLEASIPAVLAFSLGFKVLGSAFRVSGLKFSPPLCLLPVAGRSDSGHRSRAARRASSGTPTLNPPLSTTNPEARSTKPNPETRTPKPRDCQTLLSALRVDSDPRIRRWVVPLLPFTSRFRIQLRSALFVHTCALAHGRLGAPFQAALWSVGK